MHDLPNTQASLIQRIKDPADHVAWSEFLAIYQPVVYRMARRRGLQHADAEDLTQQVFASISASIGRWEPSPDMPPFRVWLFRIARNAIINAVTRGRPDVGAGSTSVQERLQQEPASDPGVVSQFLAESRMETFRWAARAVQNEFTEATWDMFWQTSVEGRPIAEVAAEHQRSPGAVYVARFRVMQRLKEKVIEVSQVEDDAP